jgi:hypothetical protein
MVLEDSSISGGFCFAFEQFDEIRGLPGQREHEAAAMSYSKCRGLHDRRQILFV